MGSLIGHDFESWNEYEQLSMDYIKEKTMELSHIIFINRQFSNAWLCKCSCGELFTGKGNSYPVSVRKHLFEAVVVNGE